MMALKQALTSAYGRYLSFSNKLDRINRRPPFHEFVQQNRGAAITPSRADIWKFVLSQTPDDIDYLEFGVYEGVSILNFARANTSPNSKFYGFDTFSGLPEEWREHRSGHFDTQGLIPKTEDSRVTFLAGMFQDTLPKFLAGFAPKNRVVVNIDCDLYSSALYCLTRLDPLLPAGTIIIFDEFGDTQHEFRAFMDYTSSYRRTYKTICAMPDFWTIAIELQ